jgi:hypothetical protein
MPPKDVSAEHYVAYHSEKRMGRPLQLQQNHFAWSSTKARGYLEKAVGNKAWGITGKQVGKTVIYSLACRFIPSEIRESANGYIIFGERGLIFNPPITLNAFDWFPLLMSEQRNFSLGFNRIRRTEVITGLEELVTKHSAIHIAEESDIEGTKTETRRITSKRSRRLRDLALQAASGVCSVCERDYSKVLDGRGVRVLQVHHRRQLASLDAPTLTKLEDLAVVCSNCQLSPAPRLQACNER